MHIAARRIGLNPFKLDQFWLEFTGGTQPSRTIDMIWRHTNPMSEKLVQIAELVREVGRAGG